MKGVKGTFVWLMGVMLVLCGVSAALAVDFSADMIQKSKGYTGQSKTYVKGQKIRMESQGMGQFTIVRGDLNKTWVIMPDQRMYMETKHNPSQVPGEKFKGEISRKKVGSETIEGHPTEKFEVTYKEGNRVMKSYQWIATDINFPIKTAAVDGSWSMEYRNLQMGAPPDSLFELPSGYQKMTMPGMPGGMKPGKRGMY